MVCVRIPPAKQGSPEGQVADLYRRRGSVLRAQVDRLACARRLRVLDRKALEQADLAVTYAEGPGLVADHGFTTGYIAQTSFERLLSPIAMKIGAQNGIGCYADKLQEDERTKAIIPDQFRHEIATAFNLRGRGLIVLTSCCHRG
jgi:7,8-dihydropterin-6-yl-methyl-4-(beta-D-ribofuranosyl)aminobenzene 5'-phosphate synthase